MNFALLRRIFRLRELGFLRLRPADRPMRLECLGGACPTPCCRLVAPPQITLEEADALGHSHVLRAGVEASLTEGPCGCCFLNRQGRCAVYDRRPKACVDYPWYNLSGKLHYDAGCPGIRFDAEGRPNASEIRPFDFYLKTLGAITRRLVVLWLKERGPTRDRATAI